MKASWSGPGSVSTRRMIRSMAASITTTSFAARPGDESHPPPGSDADRRRTGADVHAIDDGGRVARHDGDRSAVLVDDIGSPAGRREATATGCGSDGHVGDPGLPAGVDDGQCPRSSVGDVDPQVIAAHRDVVRADAGLDPGRDLQRAGLDSGDASGRSGCA